MHVPNVPITHQVDAFEDGAVAGHGDRIANWRNMPLVNYSCTELQMEFTTDDEHKLSLPLKSPERHIWLDAINEEFKTLREALRSKTSGTTENDCLLIK